MSKKNEHDSNIMLVDSSTDLSKIEFQINKYNPKIITLDYQTHKKLEKLSIDHIISDQFLDDKEKIQNKSYYYSKWFNELEIKEFVEHDGVNLGSLSYIEFFVFIIPFLKKFVEIKNIINNYKKSSFLSSGIVSDMVKVFSNNIRYMEHNTQNTNFIYDQVSLDTNFFKIKLSKNNFSKLQKMFEKITSIFLSTNNSSMKNSIFLVEFNTILYQKLFSKIYDIDHNPVYVGVRRPSIWNKSSFFIIKKSHTKIASFSNISSSTQQTINQNTKKITNNWDILLSKEDFFNNFFSYDGYSFWSVLKSYFIKLYNSRNLESIKTIEIMKNHFHKFNPKSILILSESGLTEQIAIVFAKKFHIPIILFQHGVVSFDSKKSDVINEFTGSMPIQSDKFVVWGNAMKKYSSKFGISEKKIYPLGSIAHENLFDYTSNENNLSDYVLLSPESPGQININDYDVKTNQEYEDTLRNVCQIIMNQNKKLIIKIKPNIPEKNETQIAHEIDPSIKVIKSGDMTELVKNCSVFITFGITSAMLDAAHFKKPVIRIRMREWWDSPDSLRPNSAINITLNNFENTLVKLFSDSDYLSKSVSNGNEFLVDCLTNPDSVSDKIGLFLDKKE